MSKKYKYLVITPDHDEIFETPTLVEEFIKARCEAKGAYYVQSSTIIYEITRQIDLKIDEKPVQYAVRTDI